MSLGGNTKFGFYNWTQVCCAAVHYTTAASHQLHTEPDILTSKPPVFNSFDPTLDQMFWQLCFNGVQKQPYIKQYKNTHNNSVE